MDYAPLIKIGGYINDFSIPDISEETKFWLIRTMSGYFYKEFVEKKFVALGWNYINKETSFSEKNIEILKDRIKEGYSDRRPGVSISKCKRFIGEVKPGDYVIIPNAGSYSCYNWRIF